MYVRCVAELIVREGEPVRSLMRATPEPWYRSQEGVEDEEGEVWRMARLRKGTSRQ